MSVFSANINIAFVTPYRVSRDNHSLDQLMRRSLHHFTIFESSWLSFIGITQKVSLFSIVWQKAPFHAGWETSSTTTTKPCGLYHFYDFFRLHFKSISNLLVTTMLFVAIDTDELVFIVMFRNYFCFHLTPNLIFAKTQ